VAVTRGWHEVDVGLGLLEFRETAGAAQAAYAALLVAAVFEAGVDRKPCVGPNRSGIDLAAHAAGAVDITGEHACRQAEFGRVGPVDGVFLLVEDLECGDRPEDFLLDNRCAEVLDFDQTGPVESAGG
jgi:hypothetical protein